MKNKNAVESLISNPFRPGAGHMPLYLAGRKHEEAEFRKLLDQEIILKNLVLTGLRGVGKTVLLETFKPIATQENWVWVGDDLSEVASIREENLVTRILKDLSIFTSGLSIPVESTKGAGFVTEIVRSSGAVTYGVLRTIFDETPGLNSDKLKTVLEFVWSVVATTGKRGIVFAYDEAQNLADHAPKDEFPLSLLLDVFQSIQRKGIRFLLALTGLPTLFPKLVESRTYSERMFHVVFLEALHRKASRKAIEKPIELAGCPFHFDDNSIEAIIDTTGGYPYFIQFVCKETFDVWIQRLAERKTPTVPVAAIVDKLDSDFFAGRWAKATDRQRDLLLIIAQLPNCDKEFTIQEIVEASKSAPSKPFGSSQVNQMLTSLSNAGLVYRNRHGKYSFAVPLLGDFILRQYVEGSPA